MGTITIILLIIAMVCSLTAVVISVQLAHGTTTETPFRHGYLGGIEDGKASARDWGDVCDGYNTTGLNACLKGYDLGFKRGCAGMMWYHDEHPEYMTCADYFKAIKTQK